MNSWLARLSVAGWLILLIAWVSWAQKGGAPGSRSPTGSGGAAPSSAGSNQSSSSQMQNPLFVYGRLIMEGGQPLPEPVSVSLSCEARIVQIIQSDPKGNFQFVLGAGPQANMDMGAQNDTSDSSSTGLQERASNFAGSSRLSGCTVQVAVAGYQPLSKTLTDTVAVESIDVGTLVLTPVAGVSGPAISVTSLQAPSNARKEFDKGEEEIRSNHLESATKHLNKAVAEYDRYAAAWNELGKIYSTGHQTENARQAFTKAMTADPQYLPPYVNLAALELQAAQFESAVDMAGRALELHPGTVSASFLQAVANFRLHRLDAAEKSARDAEKGLHQNIPQVHLLLADIFLTKRDYSDAAEQMRTYLKEAPQGQYASQTKQRLEQIEKTAADVGGTPIPPQIAPSSPDR